jgi:hypothetical protein
MFKKPIITLFMLRSIFAFCLVFSINILSAQPGPDSFFQDIKISTRFGTSGEDNWPKKRTY